MAKSLHVGHGIRQGITRLARGPGGFGGCTHLLQGARQCVGMCGHARHLQGALHGVVDAACQQGQALATFHQHLAAQQIHGLDTVRAFVDHVQAVVAPVLLYREVARVAVAAVDLNGQAVGLQAPLAGPALGDGGQHLQQQTGFIGRFGRARVLLVHQQSAIQVQRQGALAIGLLCQQHALDVCVLNQAHLGGAGVLAALARSAGAA